MAAQDSEPVIKFEVKEEADEVELDDHEQEMEDFDADWTLPEKKSKKRDSKKKIVPNRKPRTRSRQKYSKDQTPIIKIFKIRIEEPKMSTRRKLVKLIEPKEEKFSSDDEKSETTPTSRRITKSRKRKVTIKKSAEELEEDAARKHQQKLASQRKQRAANKALGKKEPPRRTPQTPEERWKEILSHRVRQAATRLRKKMRAEGHSEQEVEASANALKEKMRSVPRPPLDTIKPQTPRERKPFRCSTCSKRFPTEDLLQEHRMATHLSENRELFSCEECSVQLVSSDSLKRHMNTIHNPLRTRDFICLICGNSYFSRKNLQFHEKIHKIAV